MTDDMILVKGTCPNGDGVEMMPLALYTRARLREMLDAGTFMLHCGICNAEFPLTEEAILNLRKQRGAMSDRSRRQPHSGFSYSTGGLGEFWADGLDPLQILRGHDEDQGRASRHQGRTARAEA
jgi:hypothetical protein